MRARLTLLAAALALTGPTGLVVGSEAALLEATPLCGDSTGRTRELPSSGTPAASPLDDVPDPLAGTRHHKPKHKPVPPPKPPVVQPPPPPPPPSVRVASVNVLHGLSDLGDRSLEHRLSMQSIQLAAAGVDVIGAQEVSRTKNHGVIVNRLAVGLAGRTGQVWHWCFFATNPYFPGEPETRAGGGGPLSDQLAANTREGEAKFEEGVAILSRYPIVAASARRLPSETSSTLPDCEDPACVATSTFQSRGAIWGRVRTNVGEIDVFSAHTSGLRDQHADLTGWVAQKSPAGRTAIVTCDCNATIGEEVAPLQAAYADTWRVTNPQAPGYTSHQRIDHPASTVQQRIDYVWLRNRSGHRATSSTLVLDQPFSSALTSSRVLWPSDHYGVLTTFTR
jgi:endonuclease/exonuclease/phosphatase family metal-dependent hydrolase